MHIVEKQIQQREGRDGKARTRIGGGNPQGGGQ